MKYYIILININILTSINKCHDFFVKEVVKLGWNHTPPNKQNMTKVYMAPNFSNQ